MSVKLCRKSVVILFVVACVLIIAPSCSNNKNLVAGDGEQNDSDVVTVDSDEISDSMVDDITESEVDQDLIDDTDLIIDSDSEVGDVDADEEVYPFTVCDPDVPTCRETELCLFVWEKSDFYCKPSCEDDDGCDDDYVCETVVDETLLGCFPPIKVNGYVFNMDADISEPVEGAFVVGMLSGSGVSSDRITTDSAGNYSILLRLKRDNRALPSNEDALHLSVAAMNFEAYPGLLRPSLPITFDNVYCRETGCFVQSGFTSVGLYPLDDSVIRYSIIGEISEKKGGVLIIAECDVAPCPTAYSDKEGAFSILNVPVGTYSVKAYTAGQNYSTVAVEVVDRDIDAVLLELNDSPLSTLSGSINIVNAPGGLMSSVVLMPAVTFIESFAKGMIAPGLRAPDPGIAPNITSDYTIAGIPDGDYYVLAAFENDFLVRDPDPNIAGTQILKVTFPDVTNNYDITIGNFKITEAIEIIFPGANKPEQIFENPTFSWKRDASATHYIVTVYSSQGVTVWEKRVEKTASETLTLLYDGTPFRGFYQWVVVSYKSDAPISMSEDLKGIFFTNDAS